YGSYNTSPPEGNREPWSNEDSFDAKTPDSFTTDSASFDSNEQEKPIPLPTAVVSQPRTWRDYMTFAILCLINLLNYMDRYKVSGESQWCIE
ncbi:hypothetical protein PENTCL1PPCAC_2377, partial [Pristionchus entomophagus]